ncbi:MAG TPA: replicative DNA helicase [Candidatus Paceibacterota bacterium]|nr:replicative DNA helicase [Candidatus Paceibacterota bacterium]HOK97381.1 replicative DNA helicase [Candidatus Paceibacterota bacterium]HPC30824.1 replicative DNA helicase [Candidatus Pacearchaeota archaeon]HPP64854.1 replicative DNA helicase [Candidatus Paceibacterota bacterium]
MSPEEKLPPQNIEAEESVLGALIIDNNAIIKIADILYPEDFYLPKHRQIFEAILDLYKKNEPVDVLSLTNRLEEKNLLKEIGGVSFLTSLVNKTPTSAHVVHYAKIVHEKKILRDLISASYQIAELGFNEEEDVNNVLDTAEQIIFNISQKSINYEFLPLKEELVKAFERIDQLHKGGGKLRGLTTGFSQLDKYLAGLQKSDLIVLGARPSLGKTSLALDIARHVALRERVPVGIFSLEMSRDQIVDRLIAAESTVDLWRIRTGRLSTEGEINDFTLIQDALSRLAEAPIYIDDAPSPTIMQMRTVARRLQAEAGLGLLVVDYLQLITPSSLKESTVQQYSEISRSLKALSRELNVPVLTVSQLSRAVEQRSPPIPRLSDLRETGAIEQDCDVAMFIYREDKYNPDTERKNIADIIIAKHRNGPLGRISLYFNEQLTSFRNLEKEEFSSEFEELEGE